MINLHQIISVIGQKEEGIYLIEFFMQTVCSSDPVIRGLLLPRINLKQERRTFQQSFHFLEFNPNTKQEHPNLQPTRCPTTSSSAFIISPVRQKIAIMANYHPQTQHTQQYSECVDAIVCCLTCHPPLDTSSGSHTHDSDPRGGGRARPCPGGRISQSGGRDLNRKLYKNLFILCYM